MRKYLVLILISSALFITVSFSNENLRSIYSRPSSTWPKPTIEDGVAWTELGMLPESPIESHKDSLKNVIELGKILFFDTRLSSSGKISCATCHQPALNWTDGKEKSIGHEGTVNKRNSPSIQNSWFYKKLFWDGRSSSLEDQAFAPINSESEMHSEMPDVIRKLRKSNSYQDLFKKAFGNNGIDPQRMTEAIAIFERTIVSNKSRFDEFLKGSKNALSKSEIRGLHLFRTKAKCMNCHNGPLFTDNQFHNIGFSEKDIGYYQVTHQDEDLGKFKTPSLRDVMKTGPWMHDGQMDNMKEIINRLDKGSFSVNNQLIKPLGLTQKEKKDLLNFLNAISADPIEFKKPIIQE